MVEFVYLIFFLSGILKSIFIHYHFNFPVDFTLFSAILLVLTFIYDIYLHKLKKTLPKRFAYPLLIIFVFYIFMLISLLYTPSPTYSHQKSFLFFLNIIAFVFPFSIKKFNIKRFFKYLIFSLIPLSLFFAAQLQFLRTSANRDLQFIGLYLILATYLGIVSVFLLTSKEIFLASKKYDIVTGLLLLSIILLLGARGPFIFAFLIIFIYIFLYAMTHKPKPKTIQKIGITIFFILIFASITIVIFRKKAKPLFTHSIKRFELLFTKTNKPANYSVRERIEQYEFAIDNITHNFTVFMVGNGIGSFKLLYKGEDGRAYPHNILLEIWFELGIVGLSIFLLFLCSIFCRKRTNTFVNHYLLVYIFLNMLKSGSLVDIRNYFVFFAIFLLLDKNKNFSDEKNMPHNIGS